MSQRRGLYQSYKNPPPVNTCISLLLALVFPSCQPLYFPSSYLRSPPFSPRGKAGKTTKILKHGALLPFFFLPSPYLFQVPYLHAEKKNTTGQTKGGIRPSIASWFHSDDEYSEIIIMLIMIILKSWHVTFSLC